MKIATNARIIKRFDFIRAFVAIFLIWKDANN